MRAIAIALAVLVSGAAWAAPGKCLLVVDGKTYLHGPCPVEVERNGSFSIGTGPRASYFAYVNVDDGSRAKGYWNETRGASHAHSDLGDLNRNGPCWSNARAIICGWR